MSDTDLAIRDQLLATIRDIDKQLAGHTSRLQEEQHQIAELERERSENEDLLRHVTEKIENG
jgi:uncharacterized protein involved in exopolysaccharide biosynthesis